ncbi:MAG: phage tail protein [Campylobacterales bacterium]|nr:phage tail protein [Campylobacterales bacterium]
MADERRDPYVGFNFRMEIDGIEVAGFKEISALGMESEVIEYFEGDGINTTVKKQPGITNYSNITFKRGIAEGTELYEWCATINDQSREVERKTVTINLLDDSGEPRKTYTLYEAWPCAYRTSDLDGSASELAMEEVEFVLEYFEIED